MTRAIDYFAYDHRFLSLKTRFSLKARKKMFALFVKLTSPDANTSVLDLGTTPDTRLADSNIFDKLYPYKKNVTICSIEDCTNIVTDLGLKQYIPNEPKKALPFIDDYFDICHCSAVLEHVGNHADQEFFLNECLRVSRKMFITTPYRYFPLEMHTFIPFLHWLPWRTFQKVVRRTKGEFWADTNNLNLCDKKDITSMKLIRPVTIRFIRTVGMRSNMIITAAETNEG